MNVNSNVCPSETNTKRESTFARLLSAHLSLPVAAPCLYTTQMSQGCECRNIDTPGTWYELLCTEKYRLRIFIVTQCNDTAWLYGYGSLSLHLFLLKVAGFRSPGTSAMIFSPQSFKLVLEKRGSNQDLHYDFFLMCSPPYTKLLQNWIHFLFLT